jgi:hypothetical protein
LIRHRLAFLGALLAACGALADDAGATCRAVAGWNVHVSRALLAQEPVATGRALELLESQLQEIVRNVPPAAVTRLRQVPLYLSPEYPGFPPRAEYHPGADWLRKNGRDPAMAKGVEFTNVRIFEREADRMPNFALHELAHAYHDLVLPQGYGNPEIKAAYAKAKASGAYDRAEHWHGSGRTNTFDRAYAITNPMEYFAESSEAFFSRNDFFPFTRDQLKRHDPEMAVVLEQLWRLPAAAESNMGPDGLKIGGRARSRVCGGRAAGGTLKRGQA